jgi:hypothetical protein
MRAVVMLLFLSLAGTCFADDPLESLNTVADTLSTMEQTLHAQAANRQEIYFLSDEPLGALGWVKVRPCNPGEASLPATPEAGSCGAAAETPSGATRLWKSRAATVEQLRPGAMVIARDSTDERSWYLARITDISQLASGSVAVSAPIRAALKDLRMVGE